jgi:translation initiation factor 1A
MKNKGGKKHKKSKKMLPEKKIMVYKEADEEYAKVVKMLGNGRLYALLGDGTEKLCIIPGKMKKKKMWIKPDDIILITIRSYQESKSDVIYLYPPSQVNILKSNNHLPKNLYEEFIDNKDISNCGFTITEDDLDEVEQNIKDNLSDDDLENINIEDI